MERSGTTAVRIRAIHFYGDFTASTAKRVRAATEIRGAWTTPRSELGETERSEVSTQFESVRAHAFRWERREQRTFYR